MDFELIERHPWITVGAIAGGGFLLFLVLRRKSAGSSDAQPGTVYASGSNVDPSIAASVQAQQDQIQGSLSGLSLQGQTQIALAQIGAGIQSQTITASQDVTNRQTEAQYNLGMGTLGAQLASEQISASVQMKTIDAIVAAFSGNHPVYNPTPTVTQPVINASGNPINGSAPPANVTYLPPSYETTLPYPYPGANGSIVPGGQEFFPRPSYASCDPRDSACVSRNQTANVNWVDAVLGAQATNNRAQCLANAQLSIGKPNYAALVAACG